MKKLNLLLAMMIMAAVALGQSVGINASGDAPDASAMLDVQSSTKGFLPPRVVLTGTSDVTTISSPATGLLIYNTATSSDVTPGYYYFNGATWAKIGVATDATQWTTTGSDIYYNSGNVGVGSATTNSSKLYIYNEVNGQRGLYVNKTADATSNYPAGCFVNGTGETLREVMLAGNSDYCASFLGGNVGIGTTLPGAKLHIEGDGSSVENVAGIIRSTGTTYGPSLRLEATGTNGKTYALYSGQTGDGNAGIFSIYEVGGGNRLVINNGNVGIGTTSPGAKLDVSGGDIHIDRGGFVGAYSATHANDGTTSTDFGSITHTTLTGMRIITTWNGTYNEEEIAFHTHYGGVSAGERVRIDKNGNVGIGTTTPAYPLHVASYTTSGSNTGRYFNHSTTNITQTTAAWNAGIYCAQDVLINGSFVSHSDLRIKENIKEVHNSLDLVRKLRPVSYNKIDKIDNGGRTEFGFIAQEVEKILPEAVNTGKGEIPVLKPFDKVEFEEGVSYTILIKNGDNIAEQKYTTKDPRPEGEIIVKSKTVDDFKSLSYDMIFTVAVDAIQEQQQLIEDQQKQIDALKAQNAELTQKANAIDELKAEVENIKKALANQNYLTVNK